MSYAISGAGKVGQALAAAFGEGHSKLGGQDRD